MSLVHLHLLQMNHLPAEEAIENVAGVSETAIHRHEDVARAALMATGLAGALSLALLWWYRRRELPRAIVGMSLLAMLVVSGLMAWTANLGGQIRHTEISGGAVAGQRGVGDDDR